jgi:hypothetical protein
MVINLDKPILNHLGCLVDINGKYMQLSNVNLGKRRKKNKMWLGIIVGFQSIALLNELMVKL